MLADDPRVLSAQRKVPVFRFDLERFGMERARRGEVGLQRGNLGGKVSKSLAPPGLVSERRSGVDISP